MSHETAAEAAFRDAQTGDWGPLGQMLLDPDEYGADLEQVLGKVCEEDPAGAVGRAVKFCWNLSDRFTSGYWDSIHGDEQLEVPEAADLLSDPYAAGLVANFGAAALTCTAFVQPESVLVDYDAKLIDLLHRLGTPGRDAILLQAKGGVFTERVALALRKHWGAECRIMLLRKALHLPWVAELVADGLGVHDVPGLEGALRTEAHVFAAEHLQRLGRPPADAELKVRYALALGRWRGLSSDPPDAIPLLEALLTPTEPISVIEAAIKALVFLRSARSVPALKSFLERIPVRRFEHAEEWVPVQSAAVSAIAVVAAADNADAIRAVAGHRWSDEATRQGLARMLAEPLLAHMMRVVAAPRTVTPARLPDGSDAVLARLRVRAEHLAPLKDIVERIVRYRVSSRRLSLTARGLTECGKCGAVTGGVEKLVSEVFGADHHGEYRCERTYEVSCGECGGFIKTRETDHAAD